MKGIIFIIGLILIVSISIFALLRRNFKKVLTFHESIDRITKVYTYDGFINNLQNKKNNQVVILSCKIKDSKEIEELVGTNEYHNILKNVAGAILSKLYDYRVVGYYNYDTFSFVLRTNDIKDAIYTSNEISKELVNPNDNLYDINLIWGIALGEETESTLRNSLVALRFAKRRNEKQLVYNEEISIIQSKFDEICKNPELIKEQFRIYYQPKVNAITGIINGAEALSRWIVDGKIIVEPLEFIDEFEEAGIISYLDLFTLEQACKVLRNIKEINDQLHITINMSKLSFMNPSIIADIKKIVAKSGVNKELIHIEIAESSIIRNEEFIINSLDELLQAGIKIDIDGFGKFNTNLSMLSKYNYNGIKLSKALIENGFSKDKDIIYFSNCIKLLLDLDLEITVVGVETEYVLDIIRQITSDVLVQGYCFYKPMPLLEFKEALNNNRMLNINEKIVVIDENIQEEIQMIEEESQEVYEEDIVVEDDSEGLYEEEIEEIDVESEQSDSIKHYEKKYFMDKLLNLDYVQKDNFNILKNNIMKYEGIKNKTTKHFDTFLYKNRIVCKLGVVGKGIRIYLSLDPNLYPLSKFPHKDVSDKNRHSKTPYLMKISSNLSVRRAIKLINDLANNLEAKENENYIEENYMRDMHLNNAK